MTQLWNEARKEYVSIKALKAKEQIIMRTDTTSKQLKYLIRMFGGLLPFMIACGADANTIMKWNASHGIVPLPFLVRLITNARLFGILLRAKDIYPDMKYGDIIRPFNQKEMNRWNRSITKRRYLVSTQAHQGEQP